MSQRVWVVLALVAITFAVFGEVRHHEFVDWDDRKHIVDNPDLAAGFAEGVVRVFVRPHYGDFIPLTYVSLLVDRSLFGPEPAGTLLVNVSLHAASAVLLFLALARMTGHVGRAAIVAAIFAVHPLRVESVAWAFERKDVLSGFFWMLSLFFYARYVEGPASARRLLPTALALAAGLLSKPMLVTLPFALLLLDFWPLRRLSPESAADDGPRLDAGRVRSAVVEKWPLFALVAASIAWTSVGHAAATFPDVTRMPLDVRLWKAVDSYGFYLQKTFWPVGLSVYYPHDWGTAPVARALAVAGVLVAVVAAAITQLRRRSWWAIGVLWFLGTLVPVIGIVQVGLHVHADRYTYVPHVGLLLALVWGIGEAVERRPSLRGAAAGVAVAVVLGLAALSWRQVGHWQNTETLFEQALRATSGNSIAHWRMGVARAQSGETQAALEHLRAAVDIEPALPQVQFELAQTLDEAGDLSGASRHYGAALELEPGHTGAASRYGMALLRQGRGDQALPLLERAVAAPDVSARAQAGLAGLYAERGRDADALRLYRQALAGEPDYVPVLNNLAGLLARSADPKVRDAQEALRLADRATRLLPRPEPAVMDTLASAHAAAGDLDEAKRITAEAIALAEARGDAATADAIRQHLADYGSASAE